MELPLVGWCYCQYIVADGITTYWPMLLPIWLMVLPYVCVGWRRQMAQPPWQMLYPLGSHFSLSSMPLTRTPSHTCSRWHLPTPLPRDGPLTLTNIDSFINLERLCSSLPHHTKTIDAGTVTTDGTMVIDRGGGLEVFLQPFSKCSSCLTTLQPITFEPVYYAPFVGNVVFIFGSHQFIFQGLATFEMNFYAIFLPNVLDCFTQAFFIWNSYMGFGLCLDVSVVLPGFWCIYLQLHSSYCPVWVFACCQGLLYVQKWVFTTYQLNRRKNNVHSWIHQSWWVYALSRHPSYT